MNVVITAGGTSEHIDAVRTITNTGTGTLASIIANKLLWNDDEIKIFYIHTTKAVLPNEDERVVLIPVEDTNSVAEAVKKVLTENKIDYFIHAMAISDYYVDSVTTATRIANKLKVQPAEAERILLDVEDTILSKKNSLDNSRKLSSNEDNLIVILKKTPKIIGMIKTLSPETHLIGFKLLNNVSTKELIDVAYGLLEKNKCDYVVANDSIKITKESHEAIIVDRNKFTFTLYTNEQIAEYIACVIEKG